MSIYNPLILANIVLSLFFLLLSLVRQEIRKTQCWIPNVFNFSAFLLFLSFQEASPLASIFFPNSLLLLSVGLYFFLAVYSKMRKQEYLVLYSSLYFLAILGFAYLTLLNPPDKRWFLFLFSIHGLISFTHFLSLWHKKEESLLKNTLIKPLLLLSIIPQFALLAAYIAPELQQQQWLGQWGNNLRFLLFLIFTISWNLYFMRNNLLQVQEKGKETSLLLKNLFQQVDSLHNYLQNTDPQQDIHQLYPRFFSILQEITGIGFTVFYLLNSSEDALEMQAQRGLTHRAIELLRHLNIENFTISNQAVVTRELQFIAVEQYPESEIKQLLVNNQIETIGSIPVISQGNALGCLTFGLRKEDCLTEEGKDMLQILSTQMGTALYYRSLFQKDKDNL